jgi:hypothetical protein
VSGRTLEHTKRSWGENNGKYVQQVLYNIEKRQMSKLQKIPCIESVGKINMAYIQMIKDKAIDYAILVVPICLMVLWAITSRGF